MGEPALARPLYPQDEYLRLKNESQYRHEYYRGEIIAMPGGSPTHTLIVSRLSFALATRLAKSAAKWLHTSSGSRQKTAI
jgi:Uma2 family endonuclease